MDFYFRTSDYILLLAILVCSWHGCFKDEFLASKKQNSIRSIHRRGKLRSQPANGSTPHRILHKFDSISMDSLAPDFLSPNYIYNFSGSIFTLYKPQSSLQWNRLEHRL